MANPARVPAGVSTGGQFAAETRPESQTALRTAPQAAAAAAAALLDDIDFSVYDLREVPALPEPLADAEITTTMDVHGNPMASIWHGGADAYAWAVDDGAGEINTYNSVDSGEDESGLPDEHERAALDHLEAVSANLLIVRHAVLSKLDAQPEFSDRVTQIARGQK